VVCEGQVEEDEEESALVFQFAPKPQLLDLIFNFFLEDWF
jgi:hypothetical protein